MHTRPALKNGIAAVVMGVVMIAGQPLWASEAGHVAADQVSEDGYRDFLDLWLYTHIGDDRGFGPEHDLARANIVDLFESYGLTVALEPFTYSSATYYNVVATKPGTVYPDQHYVVGAHFDSVSNPGADDNASGTALVLEAARILSQYDSDYTIRFVAFDREEQGLYGSSAYVAAHLFDDIRGMISADMVAYDPDTDHANIYGRTASNQIKTELAEAVAEYGDGLSTTIGGDVPYSNHAPFESAGFQACLLIEGEVWDNPYYHSSQDTFEQPGNLNFPYAVKMVRSVVGYLVDHAGVQVAPLMIRLPDGVPSRVDPETATPIMVQIINGGESYVPGSGLIHCRFDAGSFAADPLTPLGGDLYEAMLPAAACGTTAQFYFSAEGDGGSTVYDPPDAPADWYAAEVATLTTALNDDFETQQGWTIENIELSDGGWQRGIPAGDGSRGDPLNDFDGSGHCYLTGNRPGNSDVDGGPTRLISPMLDLTGLPDPILSYARWFTNDDMDQDRLNVEVSDDDGGSWTLIESVASDAQEPVWVEVSVHLADHISLTSQVRVRFSVMDNPNNSVTEAAIDAVSVLDLSCLVPGDCDGDGDADLYDYAALESCLLGPDGGLGPACGCFDADGNGDVALDDFGEFQTAFTGSAR